MDHALRLLVAAPLLLFLACGLGDSAEQKQDAGQPSVDASLTTDASEAKDSGSSAKEADSGRERDGGQREADAAVATDASQAKDSGSGAGNAGDDAGQDASSEEGPGGCTVGAWPTADPAAKGPFAVVKENDVGPGAGVEENGTQPRFVVIRPSDLAQSGRCHPVITWGNGYSDNPPTYMVLLQQLASHGFVVIASLSHYVSKGDPPPMKVGVDWVLQQNSDPASVMYRRIDTSHIGATGHSAGGFATSQLGSDPRITAIATICGAAANNALHGPALLLCGGQDTMATCSGMQSAFNGITNQPVMLANQLSATHGSWIGSIKDPFMIAATSWMRLHLMGDTAQRKMFYGADCTLCKNTSVWKVQQKMMDQ